MYINGGLYGSADSSDWAMSCVMIWDQALTDNEMILLNEIINNYKKLEKKENNLALLYK